VEFCDGQKWRWGKFSPRTSVSPANLHFICFSTIIFTITRGWQNRPGVAEVPTASQTKLKKKKGSTIEDLESILGKAKRFSPLHRIQIGCEAH
jgi:hypothetical protein